ncbi:hypothetical protein [Mycolicibacterium agri]|uniref:hypothetical protein n=1 Tax=Mycolicibacterium agri TaxID=36811 RepID=UPI0013D63A17|nr:hypothetical protein [Mycolicibacterium agri]
MFTGSTNNRSTSRRAELASLHGMHRQLANQPTGVGFITDTIEVKVCLQRLDR